MDDEHGVYDAQKPIKVEAQLHTEMQAGPRGSIWQYEPSYERRHPRPTVEDVDDVDDDKNPQPLSPSTFEWRSDAAQFVPSPATSHSSTPAPASPAHGRRSPSPEPREQSPVRPRTERPYYAEPKMTGVRHVRVQQLSKAHDDAARAQFFGRPLVLAHPRRYPPAPAPRPREAVIVEEEIKYPSHSFEYPPHRDLSPPRHAPRPPSHLPKPAYVNDRTGRYRKHTEYYAPVPESYAPTYYDEWLGRQEMPRPYRAPWPSRWRRTRLPYPHHYQHDLEEAWSRESSEDEETYEGFDEHRHAGRMAGATRVMHGDLEYLKWPKIEEKEGRLRMELMQKEVEERTRRKMEEERREAKELKKRAAEERIRVEVEVREKIEAEHRAAAKAQEAEARRNEELAKLAKAEMQQRADEMVGLIRERILHDLGMGRQANMAERDRMRAEIRAEIEAEQAARQEAEGRESTVWPSRKFRPSISPPDRLPTPRMSPSPIHPHTHQMHRPPSPENSDLGSWIPAVPDPPNTDAESESESHPAVGPNRASRPASDADDGDHDNSGSRSTMSSNSSDFEWTERRRASLGLIREELVDPIINAIAAGLAGATYVYMPRFYRQHRRRNPSESYYSESASADTTVTPRGSRNPSTTHRSRALVVTSLARRTDVASWLNDDRGVVGADQASAEVAEDPVESGLTDVWEDALEELAEAGGDDTTNAETAVEPEVVETEEGPPVPSEKDNFVQAGHDESPTDVASQALHNGLDKAGSSIPDADVHATETLVGDKTSLSPQSTMRHRPQDSGKWRLSWLGSALFGSMGDHG